MKDQQQEQQLQLLEGEALSPQQVEALDNLKPLNFKQRQFLYNYFTTGNVEASALAVGYSIKHGYSILRKPHVQAHIQQFHSGWNDEQIADVRETLTHLTDIIRGGATDVIINGKTGKLETVPSATINRIKALELLTKIMGLQQTNININGSLTTEEKPLREVITINELKDLVELSAEDIEILEEETGGGVEGGE